MGNSNVAAETVSPCNCRWLLRAVENDWFPIIYDQELQEYQLVIDCGDQGTGTAPLRYCPNCGARLPESKRGELFSKPTDEDLADVDRWIVRIHNATELIELLGKPDSTISGCGGEHQQTYSKPWKSLDLIVKVASDGRLQFIVIGKYKK